MNERIFIWIENNSELFQPSLIHLSKMYKVVDLEFYTARDSRISCVIRGEQLKFVPLDEARNVVCDVILVVGEHVNRRRLLAQCHAFGMDYSKIIFDFETMIPGFNMERCNRLHFSFPSIFSINDWGKKLYQRFHLPYLSPFIGSVMTTEDWLSFLQNPQAYLSQELVFVERIGVEDESDFPVFSMGENGLKVYMLYETDAEKARMEWLERVKQINWLDILVMMYTDSVEVLNRFDRLPYGKKVCFTSFESRLDSAFFLPLEKDEKCEELPLWASIDRMTASETPYYDLWDIILYGKRTLFR